MKTMVVNLRAEATREALRLTVARAVARAGRRMPVDRPVCESTQDRGRPLIARVRTARRRRLLAGRMLFIWQIGSEDAAGRIVATSVVPMLLRLAPTPCGREAPRGLVDRVVEIEAHVPDAIDAELRTRQRELLEVCGADARSRLVRDRAIAARHSSSADRRAGYQAGLFDRRSERAHRKRAIEMQAFDEVAQARVHAAESASTLSPSQPRLLLVLAPSRCRPD